MSDPDRAAQVEMVPVNELSPGDSPRIHGEDVAHARDLAEVQDSLPPIVVHRATMRVVDGMHRLCAAKIRGDREVAVEYVDGTTEDAFLRAVHDNVVHGRPSPALIVRRRHGG